MKRNIKVNKIEYVAKLELLENFELLRYRPWPFDGTTQKKRWLKIGRN